MYKKLLYNVPRESPVDSDIVTIMHIILSHGCHVLAKSQRMTPVSHVSHDAYLVTGCSCLGTVCMSYQLIIVHMHTGGHAFDTFDELPLIRTHN